MSNLLTADDFEKTVDLMAAVKKAHDDGSDLVSIAQEHKIVGIMLSPEAAKHVLARKAAERLISDPDALEDLKQRLGEEGEDWE